MAYACETCNVLGRYMYWHDSPRKKHQFFKIMLGDFEHQLRIPRKFAECFRGNLSSSCTLIGKSGNVWKVQIKNMKEDVFFANGWGTFVRDHGLKIHDFLVFCYVGDSFEVSVFDATGCEIEGSHFTKNTSLSSKASCRSLLHSQNSASDAASTLEADIDYTIKDTTEEEEQDSEDSPKENNFRGNEHAKFRAVYEGKGKGKVNENTDIFGQEEEELDLPYNQGNQNGFHILSLNKRRGTSQVKQSQKYFISKRRKVTKIEKQAALDMAVCHMSDKRGHMIEIVMKPTHVYQGFHLIIPKEWAVKHLLQRSDHNVMLRVPGVDSWMVGCRWTPSSQCQFRSGWSTFVLENNLEEHDVCVFELLQKGKSVNKTNTVFDVHIFRVVQEVVPLFVSRRLV